MLVCEYHCPFEYSSISRGPEIILLGWQAVCIPPLIARLRNNAPSEFLHSIPQLLTMHFEAQC